MTLGRMWFLILTLLMAGCGNSQTPTTSLGTAAAVDSSGSRSAIIGYQARKTPYFWARDTRGDTVTADSAIAGKKAIVLFFTRWCPVCDNVLNVMRPLVGQYGDEVTFYAVDYVSATPAEAARRAADSGYANAGYVVLSDTVHTALNVFQAGVATTVVIDKDGYTRMNEEFGDGTKLRALLAALTQ